MARKRTVTARRAPRARARATATATATATAAAAVAALWATACDCGALRALDDYACDAPGTPCPDGRICSVTSDGRSYCIVPRAGDAGGDAAATDAATDAGGCPPATECVSYGPGAVGPCTPTAAPDGTACNDGNTCTGADQCAGGLCAGAADVDADGDVAVGCGGTDCNDRDPGRSGLQSEGLALPVTCIDGADNDCDGAADEADDGCPFPGVASCAGCPGGCLGQCFSNCADSCDGCAACGFQCFSTACAYDCTSGVCAYVQCFGTASCDVVCGDCDLVECYDASDCRITCGDCGDVDCEGGSCLVDCTAATSCVLDECFDGDWTECGAGTNVWVCGRACP